MSSDNTDTFTGTRDYRVVGMTCDHCRRAVTDEISAINGVTDVAVDLTTGTVTVVADTPVSATDIAAAVDEAGYHLAS